MKLWDTHQYMLAEFDQSVASGELVGKFTFRKTNVAMENGYSLRVDQL